MARGDGRSTVDPEASVRALERLALALAEPRVSIRRKGAREAAGELAALTIRPPWLPVADLLFYVGLARYLADDLDLAEEELAGVPDEALLGPEARWIRSKVASAPPGSGSAPGPGVRPEVLGHYARIAERRPRSPLVRVVADLETEAWERAAGAASPRAGLCSGQGAEEGERAHFGLLDVGDLYVRQGLLVEAAEAFAWSVEVLEPDAWFGAGAAEAWQRVACCHEVRGDRTLALRSLARCYALSLRRDAVAKLSHRVREALHRGPGEAGAPPSPRAEAALLVEIGRRLFKTDLFDEALAAYGRAEAAGAAGLESLIALAVEGKAASLLHDRIARGPHARLRGVFLGRDEIARLFEEAKRRFRERPSSDAAAAAGLARCDAALARLGELAG